MLNEFRSTNITWDKATSRIYSPVTANASDENGRKLVVQIVNSGQVEDLTGATLHLYWETRDKLHDGLDVFKAVDLKKGEFELSYTTGMLSNKGVLNANLVLVDAVGRVVSERFKITVTEGIDNDAIQSENSFTTLTQALIDISNLEQNYAPRLNDLTAQLQQTEQELSSQLAKTAKQSDREVYYIFNKQSAGVNEGHSNNITGECMIIKAYGKTIMIDTGGDNRSESIKRFLQEHGITKIDYLILSHYHYDHCTNFYQSMQDYIDWSECVCYFPRPAPVGVGEQHHNEVKAMTDSLNLNVFYPNEGDVLTITNDFTITFFNCGQDAFNELLGVTQKVNDYSMVCLVKHINAVTVYSGDIELAPQSRMFEKHFFDNLDLYKMHHHGVNIVGYNSNSDYINMISPKNVVSVTNSFNRERTDSTLFDSPFYNAFYEDVVLVSDGTAVKAVSGRQDYMNRVKGDASKSGTQIEVFSNSSDSGVVGDWYSFIEISAKDIYKSCEVLISITDTQQNKFNGIYSFNLQITDNVQSAEITKLHGSDIGGQFAIGYNDASQINLLFKRFTSSITPKISILHVNTLNIDVNYHWEHIPDLSNKFASIIYGNKQWTNAPLNSGLSFIPDEEGVLQFGKVGNLVQIAGHLKGVTTLPCDLFTLPKEYRPARKIYAACTTEHGDLCQLRIFSTGVVRLNSTKASSFNADTLWYINASFMA